MDGESEERVTSGEKLRVLIVDDEPLARDGVRIHLQREADIDIVGEAADGNAAVSAIRSLAPDLVFLDVQMPGLDGFDVIEEIGVVRMPGVVFVTAYDEFALRAFEAHALDYLLKPFDGERFRKALTRARAAVRTRHRRHLEERLVAMLQERNQESPSLDRIIVRSGGRIVVLRSEELDWIEAAANYVRLHVGGRNYLLRETMAGIEKKLDPDQFVRIHRSTIVRIDRIRELEPLQQGDYLLKLSDGSRLTSSRGYRAHVMRLLERSEVA